MFLTMFGGMQLTQSSASAYLAIGVNVVMNVLGSYLATQIRSALLATVSGGALLEASSSTKAPVP